MGLKDARERIERIRKMLRARQQYQAMEEVKRLKMESKALDKKLELEELRSTVAEKRHVIGELKQSTRELSKQPSTNHPGGFQLAETDILKPTLDIKWGDEK